MILFNRGVILHYFGRIGHETDVNNTQTYVMWHMGLLFCSIVSFYYISRHIQGLMLKMGFLIVGVANLALAILYFINQNITQPQYFQQFSTFFIWQGLFTTLLLGAFGFFIRPVIWSLCGRYLLPDEMAIACVIWYFMNGIMGTPFDILLGFHIYLRGFYYIGMLVYFLITSSISISGFAFALYGYPQLKEEEKENDS